MRHRSTARPRPRIQPKLTVGPANDRFEREADQMAKQVMGAMTAPMTADIARQSVDDEELMMKRSQRVGIDDEELALKRDQRRGSGVPSPLAARRVQRVPIGPEGGDVDAVTSARIDAARRSGKQIDAPLRRSMEGAFGADFSNVRVHTGATSDVLNARLGARAFTTGADVFVRSNDYRPDSDAGRELLAHELTHVVQQGAARLLDET